MSDGYIADTSVFVAAEQRRQLGEPPDGEARISVATLTELIVGVRRAPDGPLRTLREATLARSRAFIALPYDEPVAERLGELLAAARSAGRRAGAMDAIIAATAVAHDLVVWTQDDDFAVLADLSPALRVHRGWSGPLRQQRERLDVPRADHAEVAAIDRGDVGDAEALRGGYHRGVDGPVR